MLYDLAVGAGAKVRFNARVTKIDKSKPSVTLSSGEEIYGDLIIGADGDNSIIRPLVLAEEREETEEEKLRRKEQEERELIMDRLIEEERAQEEADERVGLLKAKVEAMKRMREAKKAGKKAKTKT